jgi:hypothetical protein
VRWAVVAFVLLSIVTPLASAHIAHPSSSAVLEAGGYKLAVAPTPGPVTRGTPTVFVLVDVEEDPTRPLSGARIRFTDLSDATIAEGDFQRNDTVWETEPILFEELGTVEARIILQPDNESEGRFSFHVYTPLEFDFAPIDATSDPTAGRPYALTFQTWDRTTSQPTNTLSDLTAVVSPAGTEATNGDHVQRVDMTMNGTGTWTGTATFAFAGPWLIRLGSESGGFGPDDSAPWQVDVLADTPGTSSANVGIVATLAMVLACVLMLTRSSRMEKGG